MTDVYWLEQSEADVPNNGDWLSQSEATRLELLRFPKRRNDWRLGRWTAKRAMAVHLNMPADSRALAGIEVLASPSGAPEVFLEHRPGAAAISLSHRDGVALCAVAPSDTALGCDLEVIEPRDQSFTTDYFTAEEQAFVAQAPDEDRPLLWALLWSAKESALKALQEGLRLDTRSVSVTLGDPGLNPAAGTNEWLPLQVRFIGGRQFHGWWQRTGNFVRTLVASPPPAFPIPLNNSDDGPPTEREVISH